MAIVTRGLLGEMPTVDEDYCQCHLLLTLYWGLDVEIFDEQDILVGYLRPSWFGLRKNGGTLQEYTNMHMFI